MAAPAIRWLVLGMLLLPGCGRESALRTDGAVGQQSVLFPRRLLDDRGVTVTIASEPRRIVSLLPSHTETLFALGVGDRVVGIDDYSDSPPQVRNLPHLGTLYEARLELVLSLKPDLVLLSETSGAASPLERSGLTVWAGSPRRYSDVFRVLRAIGDMVGRSQEADRLCTQIRAGADEIERRVHDLRPIRVYYELDSTPYTVGPASFLGVMIAKAGGVDIVPPSLGDFPRVSPEAVIAADPEVIFGVTLGEVATRPGWAAIEAVRTGRVYKLGREESELVVQPGPRIVEGLRLLARRLHPGVEL